MSLQLTKKDVVSVSALCAACRQPDANMQCTRCMRVVYCDTTCQREHWRNGGHKSRCSPAAVPTWVPKGDDVTERLKLKRCGACHADIPISAFSQSQLKKKARRRCTSCSSANAPICTVPDEKQPAQGPECPICLTGASNGPLILSGCSCRGSAGMRHLACIVEYATHGSDIMARDARWHACSTCKNSFTGEFYFRLAQARHAMVNDRIHDPQQPDRPTLSEQTGALLHLAGAHADRGEYAQAEALDRKVVGLRTLEFGAENKDTICAIVCLASTCGRQGKYTEAKSLLADALPIARRVMGADAAVTVTVAMNLGNALSSTGQFVTAKEVLSSVLAQQRRLNRSTDPLTLNIAFNLANVLTQLGDHVAAESLESEVLASQTRVLGSDHPLTLRTAHTLSRRYLMLDKLDDAELLLTETLTRQQRVLGHAGARHDEDTRLVMALLTITYRRQKRYVASYDMLRSVLVHQIHQKQEQPNTAIHESVYQTIQQLILNEVDDFMHETKDIPLWAFLLDKPSGENDPFDRYLRFIGESFLSGIKPGSLFHMSQDPALSDILPAALSKMERDWTGTGTADRIDVETALQTPK